MEPLTAIFFSCTRIEMLKQSVQAFLTYNDYPVSEIIIVNDSAKKEIHDQLKKLYPDYTLVLNPVNVGLMSSIDAGYQHIKTNYFFHCEDDWLVSKRGFISNSMKIMLGTEGK